MKKIMYGIESKDDSAELVGTLREIEVIERGNKYTVRTGEMSKGADGIRYGIEPIVECIAYRLSRILRIPCVKHELCLARVIDGESESIELATIHKNIEEELINLEELRSIKSIGEIDYKNIADNIENKDVLDGIMVLDFILNNQSRNNKDITLEDKQKASIVSVDNNGKSLLHMKKETDVEENNEVAFYGNLENALRLAITSNRGNIRELGLNINYQRLTLMKEMDKIERNCKAIEDYCGIEIPNETWFENAAEFIWHRTELVKAITKEMQKFYNKADGVI